MNLSKLFLLSTLAFSLLAASSAASAGHKPKNSDCLACHSDNTLTKDHNGKPVSLFVDENKFKHSIHGSLFSCVDCHKDVKSSPHETTPLKVKCVECHSDANEAYQHSLHAKPTSTGAPAANCQDCHGGAHEVMGASDPKSPINRANIPATCGRCHGQKFLMESNGQSTQPFINYQESVHGKASENGDKSAAVCTDCHNSHAILPANDPASPIYKFNVPNTCGKCHNGVEKTYLKSIHGKAVTAGNEHAPTCTDCHGIHSIKSHVDPNSSVSEQNLAQTTCARCHESVRLTKEFGVAGNRVSTYLDSYHGLASEGGSVVVANCASCHGVHNILPSSDPDSTINHANLDKTCGQCHKGVTQRFTLNKVHVGRETKNDAGAIATRWVRFIYIPLIILVIGGMLLHNILLWFSKTRAIRRSQTRFVQRMTPQQRWQHLVLLSSFIILVITGFALKYPTSWFAEVFGMGEHLRGIIHRVAGVVLICAGVYHVFYLALQREGRSLLVSLAPGPKDAIDIWTAMRFHLGLSKVKPQFNRFNYAEKAEYWALVWGTALMAVTGVMIWANVWVGNLLARWWVDAATAIHFYEAILATLAIIVWHFYQVFFDPDVYPMNWAWWDGKMDEAHYKHEHPLDKDAATNVVAIETEKPSEKTENGD